MLGFYQPQNIEYNSYFLFSLTEFKKVSDLEVWLVGKNLILKS